MTPKIKDLRIIIKLKNNQLVARREKLGVASYVMAALIGVTAQCYGFYENLKRDPVDKSGMWKKDAIRVAEYYEVDPAELWPDWTRKLKSTYSERCLDIDDAQLLLTGAFTQDKALPIAEKALDAGYLAERMNKVLHTLPGRSCSFLLRSYGIGCPIETVVEIAKTEGISRARVNEIIAKAMRAMRHSTRSGELAEFLERKTLKEAEAERVAWLARELFANCEAVYARALKQYRTLKWLKPQVFERWKEPRRCWEACANAATKDRVYLNYLEDQHHSGRVARESERADS
jgi:hypothetical protein